ncbi:hypothetical protein J5N97_017349 [Dioscorea zingiberensis]|uniref:J domain-containing protein n=1 Tax=Dioscorea zingiberensis TaxID=325984 RepID=A0A9D5CM86_9LILI|nr:hypothetical protein J5N97_017349 [Dioscorea zingiberensis]
MDKTLTVKSLAFFELLSRATAPTAMPTLFLGEVTIPRSFAPPRYQRRGGLSSRRLRLNCGAAGSKMEEDWVSSPTASPYQILGIDPMSCSSAQLKAAFRARVKEYHPDVCKDMKDSDLIIKRVIHAYEVLLKHYQHESPESIERTCLDPFEDPECEAYDLFVNEVLCMGKGCSYSCVDRAPHAFSFIPENGTARAISQGHDEDYLVQLAIGQCPRRCIYYVTPSQRVVVLGELLYGC